MKKTRLTQRIVIGGTLLLSMSGLISIGFASWNMTFFDEGSAEFSINADTVNVNMRGVTASVESCFSISHYFFDNGDGALSETGDLIYTININQSNLDSDFIINNKLSFDGSLSLDTANDFSSSTTLVQTGKWVTSSYVYSSIAFNISSAKLVLFSADLPVTVGGGNITYKLKFTFDRTLCNEYRSSILNSSFVLRLGGAGS